MSDENSTAEEWRPVPGFPGYEVSDKGRVRSKKMTRWGTRANQWRLLKMTPNSQGYPTVHLGKGKVSWSVHKIVLTTFVGPAQPGQMCRHLDGDKLNNHLENLRWGTCKENHDDMVTHGTLLKGPSHGRAKLTWDSVLDILATRHTETNAATG